jgi:DNA-binding transcriptional regulator YdaS (Cro superfamily)
METPLERAVGIAGSQSKLAGLIGMSQQRLHYTVKHSRPLPGEFVLRAETATGVSRHELRPDLYPIDLSPVDAADSAGGETIAAVNSGQSNTVSHGGTPLRDAQDEQDEEPSLALSGSYREPSLDIPGLAA